MAANIGQKTSSYTANFIHVEPETELQIKKQLAQFAQVDHVSVANLSLRTQEKIKAKLISMDHWAASSATEKSPNLAERLASDSKTLKDADIDRIQMLRFFELVKDVFDNYMKHNDKAPLPLPKGVYVSPKKTITSRSSVDMELLSDVQKIDVPTIISINELVSASPVNAVFDSQCAITRQYLDIPAYKDDVVLQKSLKMYEARVTDSRNHYCRTIGHAEHVVKLTSLCAGLVKQMPERNLWRKERESMVMIGKCLIIYRVEWSTAEYCPIYGHFEKKSIAHKRGNVDWFICNTNNKSYVWVPDLVVYQIGLFGFLQGSESPYRLDLLGYRNTVVEAYSPTDPKRIEALDANMTQ